MSHSSPAATTPDPVRKDQHSHPSTPQSSQSPSTITVPGAGSMTVSRVKGQTKHFSLRSWLRNAPWGQYFKSGCRVIVKSPLNFFIFFCCLSVVVWGAFLVLLSADAVKLPDAAAKELWIEIASQVLNAIFTLANVPVHPKRFLGFIRGFSIWKENRAIRQQFVARFLKDHTNRNVSTGFSEKEPAEELLGALDYYRCFPEYGRSRTKEQGCPESSFHKTPSQTCVISAQSEVQHRTNGGLIHSSQQCSSLSCSRPPPRVKSDMNASQDATGNSSLGSPLGGLIDQPSNNDNEPTPEHRIQVDIEEDELLELLADETHRVMHSAVMPFLPFPLDMSGNVGHSSLDEKQDPAARSGKETHSAPVSPRLERRLERGLSQASLSRVPTKRSAPRTSARTMSMVKEAGSSANPRRLTFVYSPRSDSAESGLSNAKPPTANTQIQPKKAPRLIPMPPALTREQMDWVDERQERLLQQQERLLKAWPWYNYTIPARIEPVDFFAPAEQQPTTNLDHSSHNPIMLTTLPTKLIIGPVRFCVILGLFNVNSIVQEVLCGFMWGTNRYERPGWIVGAGTGLGFVAGILSTVLIVKHEIAMSRVRVVATAEEAIQDVIDEERRGSYVS